MAEVDSSPENSANEDRRKFLVSCGKFAAVTPPAMTLLLSTSLDSSAVAHSGVGSSSGGRRGDNGFGDGGNDGSPNGKFGGQSNVR